MFLLTFLIIINILQHLEELPDFVETLPKLRIHSPTKNQKQTVRNCLLILWL